MTLNSPIKEDTTNSRFAAQFLGNLAANIAYLLVKIVQCSTQLSPDNLTVNLQRENYTTANRMRSKAIYNPSCQGSLTRVRYHSNNIWVTLYDTEYNPSTIVVVHRLVQISPSGVT